MSDINDAELHEIVQRVIHQVMGDLTREPSKTPFPSPARTAVPSKKIVAIGADHGGFEMKEALKSEITTLGFEIRDLGTNSKDAVDYPDFAHAVAQAVGSGN